MNAQDICRIGTEARCLSMRDREALQSRVNVMYINGESEEKILAYAEKYKAEFALDLSATVGIGEKFVRELGRMGWILLLLVLVAHYATL